LVGLALTLSVARAADPGTPLVTAYSSSDIGVDAMSFSATQDAQGVLYVGVKGILRFDGEEWIHSPIPGTYAVRGLDFGPDGRLWVAAAGEIGWLEPGPTLPWKFHSLRAFLPAGTGPLGEMWHAFAAGDGSVIFVSADRVLRWRNNQFEVWPFPGSRRITAFRLGSSVYVHHYLTGLHVIGSKGPEEVFGPEVVGYAGLFRMVPRAGGWLLFTSEGLFTYDGERREAIAPEASDFVRQGRITSVVRLPDGRHGIGTFSKGIGIVDTDGRLLQVLNEAGGLPSDNIKAMFVDRDGQLWAMSAAHVFRVDLTTRTTVFDARRGLPEQSYHAIVRQADRVIVAAPSRLYELHPGAEAFVANSNFRDPIQTIQGSSEGLLVGGFRGAKRLAGDRWEQIHSTEVDVFAFLASVRTPGRLFLSDKYSVLAKDGDASPRLVVEDLRDYVRSLAEDDAGQLWLGTRAEGVHMARLAPVGAVRAIPPPPDSKLPTLTGSADVRATRDGTVLVVAENGAWIKPAGQPAFVPVAGFPDRSTTAVSDFDADDSVWVVHPATSRAAAAAGRIALTAAGARWEPHAIPGLSTIGYPLSAWVDSGPERVLWLGGTRKVLRHVLPAGPSAPRPRAPILRAFAADERDGTARVVAGPLPFSTPRLVFGFAAPEFSRRSDVRLETRIDGLDTDWVPAGGDSQRELLAVRDGLYRFSVRVVAEPGVASEPTTVTVTVRPPWWRTSVAAVLAALGLIPAGYGLYRWRVRTLRRRNAELEVKVRQRTEELEAASAAKTAFVANMSHDIRNPLNGIVGLSLALEDSTLDRRQREIVATLRECTTYLSSLVDDVLDFASIEAGRIELRSSPYSPPELLRSIVETLKADAAESGAALTTQAAPDVPPALLGDAGRIQQILVNFVSNALKYAGGHIRLQVAVPEESPEEVEFSVVDQGPGLTPAELATLFSKFTRLKHKHGSDPIPGTGLGLAACRLLADAMGGSVGVESQPGRGARFYCRLPLVIAREVPAVPAGAMENASVLLVEDTDYNAWAAAAVLARLGLSCERATTGEEALRFFTAKRYNVVLLDRNLPDMDGTEVARRMRELETDGARAVLLAVTAYCTADDRALCLQSGMDAFVGKPLTPEKLRRVLSEASRQLVGASRVHVAPETATTAVNLDLLSYLADGSEERLQEQLRRFAAEMDDTLAQSVVAENAQDFAALAALAHRMRGPARMVDCAPLDQAASRLEVAARTRDAGECRAWLTRVGAEAAALKAAMFRRRPAVPSA
jgi:signal transduction histidine kinase/CheY-like chemotaxis protein